MVMRVIYNDDSGDAYHNGYGDDDDCTDESSHGDDGFGSTDGGRGEHS